MFDYKYLSKEHLKGFNKYKYSAIDTSPLSQYVMHPTWNTLVKVLPKSVAPNLLTFLGFVCMVVSVILLTVYDYDFYATGGRAGVYPSEIPPWVFTAVGVFLFVAYNLDGMDGKQARRIGVSGPLGELFDHGLDSYIVFLIPYCIISIFGRDPEYSLSTFRGFLLVISVVLNFYISHIEKYSTGTLYLPWGYDVSMWYSAIDTSPLSQYVMHPTWNTLVKVLPKSVAPNLLTFLGFVCMVVSVILLTVYDYDFYATGGRAGVYPSEIPPWVFTAVGVFLFVAYNLDGMDGKQARRIGVSGPLGELFDHGLDSYIVFLIPYCIISIFGRDPEYSLSTFRGFLLVISVVLNFYISHIEKYSTGTLYLPWGYDVSMWVSSILFILAGVYGPEYYKFYVFGDWTFIQCFEIIIHAVGLVTTMPVAVYNVYLSYKNRTGKRLPFMKALKPAGSIAVVTISMVYWAMKSPNNIIAQHPRAFIFLYGTLFSNVATRLIIAEMTHKPCELFNFLTWPLLTALITSVYMPQWETVMLHTLLVVAVLAHVHYGICVVKQICAYLNISCFSVPKEKRK